MKRTLAPITRKLAAHLMLVVCLNLGFSQAHALTIVLDFVTTPDKDIFGLSLIAPNYSQFNFSNLSTGQIQSSLLSAVTQDFLNYPVQSSNASSPLPAGKQLNISFEMSNGKTSPSNLDPNYYYFAIGNRSPGVTETYLGHACLGCVRKADGSFNSYYQGKLVGAVLVDNIDDLASLAKNNQQRINLLAGTISHEIGHSLSLEHPVGPLLNPGQSSYSLLGTGASPTNMPSGERTKDRAFSYTEYAQLMSAVGLRDVSPVPEPSTYITLLAGLGLLGFIRRNSTHISRSCS